MSGRVFLVLARVQWEWQYGAFVPKGHQDHLWERWEDLQSRSVLGDGT